MANDWISVEDRLPIEGVLVWAVHLGSYVNVCWYGGKFDTGLDVWKRITKGDYIYNVTHWMPIDVPVPPKENR